MELYKARDIVKKEIYEITGFSDIVRGQSKASETLGAQQIKAGLGVGAPAHDAEGSTAVHA
jgi:hypothetical protein